MEPQNPQATLPNGDPNLFGVALLAGRLVGTVVGSDGHITIRATCKAKNEDSGRWKNVAFADATHVFIDVPTPDDGFADKIGTWYPAHSSNKWAGRFFVDRAQSDDRRVKAARYLLDVAAGVKAGTHVLLADRCLRCSREITHPDSIGTGFGPECAKKVGAFMPNRSGTPAGAHTPKAKGGDPAGPVEPDAQVKLDVAVAGEQIADRVAESGRVDSDGTAEQREREEARAYTEELLRELSDAELVRAIISACERGDKPRASRYRKELTQRNYGRPLAQFVPVHNDAYRLMFHSDGFTASVEGAAAHAAQHDSPAPINYNRAAAAERFVPPTPAAVREQAQPIVERTADENARLRFVLRLGDDPRTILNNNNAGA